MIEFFYLLIFYQWWISGFHRYKWSSLKIQFCQIEKWNLWNMTNEIKAIASIANILYSVWALGVNVLMTNLSWGGTNVLGAIVWIPAGVEIIWTNVVVEFFKQQTWLPCCITKRWNKISLQQWFRYVCRGIYINNDSDKLTTLAIQFELEF